MNFIEGKIALITGATSGIGKATAKALNDMGVNLILTGRDEKKLNDLKNSLEVETLTYAFDVRDKDAVSKTLQQILSITHIDILINNAGLALGLEAIDEGNTDDWDTMIDTNIKGIKGI